MASKRIKTRELLRNFKTFKELLKSGRIQHLYIDIHGERDLELSLRPAKNSGKQLAAKFRALPKPIKIRRTHIFDTLLRR